MSDHKPKRGLPRRQGSFFLAILLAVAVGFPASLTVLRHAERDAALDTLIIGLMVGLTIYIGYHLLVLLLARLAPDDDPVLWDDGPVYEYDVTFGEGYLDDFDDRA